ncbi:MAG: DUF3501 family protein [Deltaproteobacteria bacterium]|nr:MAG: DUF3501 family protein [Deltaproteobacteria bacterium]
MAPLTRADILDRKAFEAVRPQHQAEVIAAKAVRRVPLGEHFTFLFENRTTILWQIHEMCRVEGIEGDAIDHELATYNALLPGPDSLSATLLIEYVDPEVRDAELRRLVGLHEHVFLDIDGVAPVYARFDDQQFNPERISSVQFLRFALSDEARDGFMDMRRGARLVVDHPVYQAQIELPRATRGALIDDLEEAAR